MPQRGPSAAPAPGPADRARAASVRGIAEELARMRGPLLPILHAVVAAHGYVHDDDIPVIAEVLNLSRADVLGVVSFYHDFRRTPPAAHRVALCRAEACQARGADATYAAATDRWAGSTEIELGEVFCLGNCALGPAGTLDGALHARLTPERLDTLTAEWDR
ncbi:NAD(P)H-dependent oxidoreductase subunit E [Phycicoccus duodecadis]|uniref:Formate dehydrogenase gamma subunit n=1 Tax=Phycicoccus duodecadis TaxID=173053 RepID=A0A2N3YMM3_9MICO|nr:NAD(P)H-dependent oxidoreductase subunit E [Phycicoccus duodecadis]PKW28103.1 formate dehydrogenase gamma subunit [Phycicoccus duodecadis]